MAWARTGARLSVHSRADDQRGAGLSAADLARRDRSQRISHRHGFHQLLERGPDAARRRERLRHSGPHRRPAGIPCRTRRIHCVFLSAEFPADGLAARPPALFPGAVRVAGGDRRKLDRCCQGVVWHARPEGAGTGAADRVPAGLHHHDPRADVISGGSPAWRRAADRARTPVARGPADRACHDQAAVRPAGAGGFAGHGKLADDYRRGRGGHRALQRWRLAHRCGAIGWR